MAAAIRLSQQHSCSLDHLVGAGEEGFGNREANRFRGFDVDDQLELRRLHYGKIAGLVALEDPSGIAPDLMIRLGQAAILIAHGVCLLNYRQLNRGGAPSDRCSKFAYRFAYYPPAATRSINRLPLVITRSLGARPSRTSTILPLVSPILIRRSSIAMSSSRTAHTRVASPS